MSDASSVGTPRLVARYDSVAHRWHRKVSRLGYPAAYAALFADSAHGARVLDIGTGTGAMAEAWCRVVGTPKELVLLDPSREMLDQAGRRLARWAVPMRRLAAGAGSDEVPEERFDVVLLAHVLEHLPDPDSTLAWIRTRLRPGGTLYLAASRPHWCTALLRWVWGHQAFSPEDMRARLERAGLVQISTIPFPIGPPSRTSMGYIASRPTGGP